MDFAPKEAYQTSGGCTLIIFDIRCPEAAERLHRERAAWQEHADIEALDEDHLVLIIKPGGAWRLTA